MPLKFDRRSATIGSGINTRAQKHGTENVTALDIPIRQFCVTETELADLMLNPKAYKLMYSKVKGRPDEPAFPLFGALPHRGKIPGVNVVLFLGRRKLQLIDVTLTSSKVESRPGGITWWHFTVQCTPDLDEKDPIMEILFGKLGEAVDVSLECAGYGAQPDLPLEEPLVDEDQADIEDETAGSVMGRDAPDPEAGLEPTGRRGKNIRSLDEARGRRGKKDKPEKDPE